MKDSLKKIFSTIEEEKQYNIYKKLRYYIERCLMLEKDLLMSDDKVDLVIRRNEIYNEYFSYCRKLHIPGVPANMRPWQPHSQEQQRFLKDMLYALTDQEVQAIIPGLKKDA